MLAAAAARAQPDSEQSEHFRALIGSLDGLSAAVSDAHGSQQMLQHLDAVQNAVNGWGAALPADPGTPARRQLAFPLAHLLYDARRMQDLVHATVTAAVAEWAAARDQSEAVRQTPAAATVAEATGDGVAADGTGGRETPSDARRTSDQQPVQGPSEPPQDVPEPRSAEARDMQASPGPREAPRGAADESPSGAPSEKDLVLQQYFVA
ncbi:hypothetical protein ABZ705_30800 [Streptomyces sp. NPDC006984]|uniref:hypothetical protein n=1 Tax=Streptomyces sp. NPDC006984 TaxID=3155463 RepID=UPI0033E8FBA9